jgi:hypothetical protein
MIIFCLARNIRVVIRNVRIIITDERRSIKILSEINNSPEEGRRDSERNDSQRNVNVLEFQIDLEDWWNKNIRAVIGKINIKILLRMGILPS